MNSPPAFAPLRLSPSLLRKEGAQEHREVLSLSSSELPEYFYISIKKIISIHVDKIDKAPIKLF